MQLYGQLLKITEEIESSLKNDAFEALVSLQSERLEIYTQIQAGFEPRQPAEIASLIRLIKNAEERCITLAKGKKNFLGEKMGATGRAKKLHNAYSRQALAY